MFRDLWDWVCNIPWRIGKGYALARERAREENIFVTGPILGILVSPFNALAFYVPKILRRGYAWMTDTSYEDMAIGLLVLSPIVAYGLSREQSWALAVLGHEIGHCIAFASTKFDWWYWTGIVAGVWLVAITPLAWFGLCAWTVTNEAWASWTAHERGYVRSWGYPTLVLFWSTYLLWSGAVIGDVLMGLDPMVTGSA